ncbi:hypothetical protein AMTR_s00029p00158900 [Amborella trichopoda]|uniref:Uncharacterized protein n=1 Tax=Amborella trichopoda TaxID=13333 RepID=W1PNB3_AMBTC|nr:hypothetical protein AMTR_s00029p00158900 [Amborella trichopoda]
MSLDQSNFQGGPGLNPNDIILPRPQPNLWYILRPGSVVGTYKKIWVRYALLAAPEPSLLAVLVRRKLGEYMKIMRRRNWYFPASSTMFVGVPTTIRVGIFKTLAAYNVLMFMGVDIKKQELFIKEGSSAHKEKKVSLDEVAFSL